MNFDQPEKIKDGLYTTRERMLGTFGQRALKETNNIQPEMIKDELYPIIQDKRWALSNQRI